MLLTWVGMTVVPLPLSETPQALVEILMLVASLSLLLIQP